MQALGRHLTVGDYIQSHGEVSTITGTRIFVTNEKGETVQFWFRPTSKFYLLSGPTFTRCASQNIDAAWKLDPPRPPIAIINLGTNTQDNVKKRM